MPVSRTDSESPTVTILSPGSMGASLAHLLIMRGCKVLTSLAGRSSASQKRAEEAGMIDVDNESWSNSGHHSGSVSSSPAKGLRRILEESDWILSIMPPGEAEDFIKSILHELYIMQSSGWTPKKPLPVFVDCNAKNSSTARYFASLFTSSTSSAPIMTFIDACIVGLPPLGPHNPTIYVCASPPDADKGALDNLEGLNEFGLKVKALRGGDIGDASALKMAFSVGDVQQYILQLKLKIY